jgi:hypothetical protein
MTVHRISEHEMGALRSLFEDKQEDKQQVLS